jgi:hypothetical protein
MSEHPIQLLVTDDRERDRLTVFFRGLLAIPHFIWLLLWSIVALLAAFANWLATLALGRSPSPLHRFLSAYVKYVTQFFAYLHLAANPYPSFDGSDGYPVDLTIAPPARQSRWSVAFRLLLLVPSLLLFLALVGNSFSGGFGRSRFSISSNIGLLAAVSLLGWFAIMARRWMPHGLRDAAAYALSYGAQFWAYALLLTDRYPDSDPMRAVPNVPVRSDPIHVELDDDLRRSRLTVFFRLPLVFPHIVWLLLWSVLAELAAIVNWLVTLIAGRSPAWLHRFLAAYLRYQLHVYSFFSLIANPFPGFVGRAGSYPFEVAIAARERQNRWKTGFRAILAIPALLLAGAYGTLLSVVALLGWFSCLALARMPRGLRNAGALVLRYQAQTYGYLLLLSDSYPYGGPARNPEAGAAHLSPDQPQSTPVIVPALDEPAG